MKLKTKPSTTDDFVCERGKLEINICIKNTNKIES